MTSPADAKHGVDLESVIRSTIASGPLQTAVLSEVTRLKHENERLRQRQAVSIAVLAFCPECRMQHVDRGEWETRPHRSHLCEHCGHVWRLAMVPTVGVAALAQATPEVEP